MLNQPLPSLFLAPLTVLPYPPPKREQFSSALSVFIRKRGEVQSEKGRGATLSSLLRAANLFWVSTSYSFSPSFFTPFLREIVFSLVLLECSGCALPVFMILL